jgi:hypothetical protein
MNVIFDTNIFRSDYLLRSKDFDILIDYLLKTESDLIVPQIVLDEIKGLYIRDMTERIEVLKKATNNFNLMLPALESRIVTVEPDTIPAAEDYIKFIRKKFRILDRQIIPYNNDYLPEISTRAINRQKPAGEKGQGFRDTLLWLTIKDHCKKCHEKQITFISNNSDDFSNASKDDLHESLITDCLIDNIKINYFRNLKDFIEKHSTKIDFVTQEWVMSNMDDSLVSQFARDNLNGKERRSILSWFQRENGNPCEHYRVRGVNIYGIHSPTVYEMADNTLIVNVIADAQIEVEFDYITVDYINYYNSDGLQYDYDRNLSSTTQNIDALLYISLTVMEGDVIDTDLADIDF